VGIGQVARFEKPMAQSEFLLHGWHIYNIYIHPTLILYLDLADKKGLNGDE